MPLPDHNSRVLGRFNLFDLFVVATTLALVVLGYLQFTAAYRVAPPYALEENRVRVRAELQLPADQAWICTHAQAGQAERDPRTGAPQAEVLGCTLEGTVPVVALRLHAVRDDAGRVLFEGMPLLPGRVLQIDTEAAVLEGVVRSVELEDP